MIRYVFERVHSNCSLTSMHTLICNMIHTNAGNSDLRFIICWKFASQIICQVINNFIFLLCETNGVGICFESEGIHGCVFKRSGDMEEETYFGVNN